MSTRSVPRDFTCSIARLLREGKRIADALADAKVGPAVVARFPKFDVVQRLTAFRSAVETGQGAQVATKGVVGQLTVEQATAFTELERLMTAARRSAKLAFPDNATRLHLEFRVGEHEPSDLASILGRARIIHDSTVVHQDALGEHGWLPQDSADLKNAIAILEDLERHQEGGKEEAKDHTGARNASANAYYALLLSIQNAARLAYPNTRAAEAGLIEARGKFLLDTFPPRRGDTGDGDVTGEVPPAGSGTNLGTPTA
ncbi:MAG: hypothetical protein JSR82_09105 [Verrucomicrobia bacterium]|nr:hypothetical protein [Verrucomicrobiota bacterium]